MGFESELIVKQVADFDWVLVAPLQYRGNQDLFEVPTKSRTNFASVPAIFQWVIPRSGRYTRAAVLHDHLWRTGKVSRADADGIFRRAMAELEVPFLRRWLMWAAVRVASLFQSHFRDQPIDIPRVLFLSLIPGSVVENRTRVIAERVAELIAQRGRKLFGELKEQADVDVLTGLFSRRYLDRRLPVELEVSTDRNMPFTVALLDIDHFGAVNKTHGFPTGDKVLNQVAARIRANTRSEDWAARYGGEEICVVMLGASIEVARPALERIRSAVAAETFRTTGGQEIAITVSGGAAERDGDESLLTLMERVSRNLLSAKQGGRNRIVT